MSCAGSSTRRSDNGTGCSYSGSDGTGRGDVLVAVPAAPDCLAFLCAPAVELLPVAGFSSTAVSSVGDAPCSGTAVRAGSVDISPAAGSIFSRSSARSIPAS